MIYYLFILHFVADFLLQSREMAENKSKDPAFLKSHILIIFCTFLLGVFFVDSIGTAFKFSVMNALIHGAIDSCIWNLYKLTVHLRDKNATEKTWKYWTDHLFYVAIGLDQLLHFLTIVAVWEIVK